MGRAWSARVFTSNGRGALTGGSVLTTVGWREGVLYWPPQSLPRLCQTLPDSSKSLARVLQESGERVGH